MPTVEAAEPRQMPRLNKPNEKSADTPSAPPAPSTPPEPPQVAQPVYMTRRQAVQHVREKLGVPVKESTIAKKAMRGAGPKPDRFYGKVELFTPETIEKWVLSELCASKPMKLNAS
jgi:hypothetical protein